MRPQEAAWEMARPLPQQRRAWRTPGEQPRLPRSAGTRDLYPLAREPQRSLPPRGCTRRVETLRRHLVDDALSALNWLSRKREPFPFACNQMQDACVGWIP